MCRSDGCEACLQPSFRACIRLFTFLYLRSYICSLSRGITNCAPLPLPTCPPPLLFFPVFTVGPIIATTGHRFDPACPLRVTKESPHTQRPNLHISTHTSLPFLSPFPSSLPLLTSSLLFPSFSPLLSTSTLSFSLSLSPHTPFLTPPLSSIHTNFTHTSKLISSLHQIPNHLFPLLFPLPLRCFLPIIAVGSCLVCRLDFKYSLLSYYFID